jgi:PAS domain S-box-containing protein
LVYANHACIRLFGVTGTAEILGRSPFEFFHPEEHERIKARIAQMQTPGRRVPTIEERVLRPDGSVIEAEVTAVSFEHDMGPAVLVMLHDVTQRKTTERQLQHAQRLEAIGQLTSGMAHDFNNLLTVVIGNLDLLKDRLSDNPECAELAEVALKAGLRGAGLTQQLLAFSRRQSLVPLAFDLNAMVVSTTTLLRRTLGEQVEVSLHLADDLWPAFADPSQLESALTNLAINGRDAMPEGGRLTIETGNRVLDDAYADANTDVSPGKYVMLAVSDNGTGIPPELIDKVFEPFFSTKTEGKGSGLGLAMIYGFAKQSGGHVKIYSEVGRGTTVRLYVPAAEGVNSAEAETSELEEGARSGAAIVLLVDDNEEVRKTAARQLQDLGYRIIEAEGPAHALDVLRGDSEVDLLFTDIVMPGGINGEELAAMARRLRPGLPVLFTSGFARSLVSDPLMSQTSAQMLLLSKPYRRSELARQVAKALG